MTTLTNARPEDLLRCGAVLGRVAEQVSLASSRTQRATALEWRGLAGSAYELQMSAVVQRLRAIERAYDQACDVLVEYSRGLAAAHELALQADALERQAESDRLSDLLAGSLVPGLALHVEDQARRADHLRVEALDLESGTARRAADVLDQLTAEAPRTSAGGSALRWAADAAHGFGGSVLGALTGFGTMAQDAALSLPFVRSADSRHEHRGDLADEALALLQPWLAVERLLAEWQAHHEGAAVGELGGALLMRKTHPGSKEGTRFGYLDDMHESVLRAVYSGARAEIGLDEQWVLQRAQARWDADIERLRHRPPASLDQLLAGEVDLVHAEALGGHAIRKHVGRDWDFLLARSVAETRFGDAPMTSSSFRDLIEAERLVSEGAVANANRLSQFAASQAIKIRVSVPVGQDVGRVLVGLEPSSQPHFAIIEYRRTDQGSLYVHTAFVGTKSVD